MNSDNYNKKKICINMPSILLAQIDSYLERSGIHEDRTAWINEAARRFLLQCLQEEKLIRFN